MTAPEPGAWAMLSPDEQRFCRWLAHNRSAPLAVLWPRAVTFFTSAFALGSGLGDLYAAAALLQILTRLARQLPDDPQAAYDAVDDEIVCPVCHGWDMQHKSNCPTYLAELEERQVAQSVADDNATFVRPRSVEESDPTITPEPDDDGA